MSTQRLSTKQIEDLAINYVVQYLKKKGESPEIVKRGVDVISGDKWIEVKGCMTTSTNIRVVPQTMKKVEDNDKLDDFYIYYVYDIASGKPKLMIFDNNTFTEHRKKEYKWFIQPFKIQKQTGKPEIIQ